VAVAAVTFTVDGVDVFTDTSYPYQATFSVPKNAQSLTVNAWAIDLGSNVSSSHPATVSAISDPLTTVVGHVVDRYGLPVADSDVSTQGINGKTIADGSFSIFGVPTISGNIVVNASATLNGKLTQGQSSSIPPVSGGLTDVGNIRTGDKRIALVQSDAENASSVKAVLASTGHFLAANIDIIDAAYSTPSLATLKNYDAVLVWSNRRFLNSKLLGNTLADYVDQGGGVVIATYALSGNWWGIAGRISTEGMSPFAVSLNYAGLSGILDLQASNVSHPILAGVFNASYWVNSNTPSPPLTLGATLIAKDTSGNNLVSVNANNTIVGIAFYPGYVQSGGGADLIIANALDFVK
jgi:hypothetical protein